MQVRELEWYRGGCWADGLGIEYRLSEGVPGFFEFYSPFRNDGPFTLEEAQAFAQDHFEKSVLGQITYDKKEPSE